MISLEEHVFENPSAETENRLFVSQLIEKTHEEHKGQQIRVCYSLPQNLVSCFSLSFPFREKFKILKTLPFEIESHTPFPSEKALFDARLCGTEGRRQSRVMCFVSPKETVKHFMSAQPEFKKFPPFLLSCDGSALANLVESRSPLPEPQNTGDFPLYIYLGAQNSRVLFYKKGVLSDIFVLDWSVRPIVKKMEKLYHLSPQKAWREFLEKSFVLTSSQDRTKEQVFFSNMVKKHVQAFLPKFRLLKMSLEADQEISIKKLAVLGPGACIKNLSAFLSAELSLNVFKLKAWPGFSVKESSFRPLAGMALGLALEGLKTAPWQGLNFLHSFKRESFSLFSQKQRRVALLLLTAFVVMGAWAFIRKQESAKALAQAQSVFMDYGKNVAFLQKAKVKPSAVQSFLKKRETDFQNDKLLKEELNRAGAMERLQKITSVLDPQEQWDLRIQDLKILSQKVEIKGHVSAVFIEELRSRLADLAKGPLKENPVSGIKGEKALPVSARPTEKAGEGEDPSSPNGEALSDSAEAVPAEGADSAPSSPGRDQQDGSLPFSYSFEMG